MVSKRQFVLMIGIGGIIAAATGCAAQAAGVDEGAPKASESTGIAATPLEAEQNAGAVTTDSESYRPPFYNCLCRIDGELQVFCTTPTICWHVCPDP